MLQYRGYSSYLTSAFASAEELVKQAQRILDGVEYDTMVGTGLSGGLVVPALARLLNKEFALIRKSGDSSHREREVEGSLGDRWIFVDDFVSSGDTLARVRAAIDNAQKGQPYGWDAFKTEYVGTYQYARSNFVRSGGYF